MKILTHRRAAATAVLSVAALAFSGVSAFAAPPTQNSPFQAAINSRISMMIEDAKYLPAGLTPDRTIRVIIEFDAKSVVEMASSNVELARATVRSAQDPIVAALSRAGAKVERRYTETISGVSARVKIADLKKLSGIAGLRSVEPVTIYLPDNGNSNNHTGAAAAWQSYGVTGEDINVAIIDTGIDYGHADFGGVGTTNYFDSNDTKVLEQSHPFPTAKVIAGYDFVGDAYNASSDVEAEYTPMPDPDPMDCNGHGTHVAGTTAGFGVNANGSTYSGPYTQSAVNNANLAIDPGSAPEANLMAYRVFGCEGSADSSVIVAAIDRAVEDGADIINMSLGSAYGRATGAEQSAIARAAEAGVLTVASAGNNGYSYYLTGGPGTANSALSVAAMDGIATFPGAILSSGMTSLTAINANDGALPGGALEVKVLSNGNGGVSLGCSAEDYVGVTGKLVVTARGVCARVDRAILGQAAGAAAVVMINNAASYPVFEGDIPGVTIPFFGLKGTDGAAMVALDGQMVNASGATVSNPSYKDPAEFTSSGPRGMDGGVKPDVSAPGVGVVSASVGTGNGRETLSGTSMAAPHAAGVAALVLDKNPSWSGQDVKNALVNTASLAGSAVNALYPQRIRGAGLIQPGAAMDATIVMQSTSAGDTGLSFGIQEGKSFSGRTKIMVDNLTGQTKWVTLSAIANNGATLSVSPSRVRVGAFTKSVTVRLTMSRSVVSALSPASDTFLPITLGRITASVDEVPVAALPVQVIQHNRSDIEADYSKRKNTITVRNDGYGAGAADLYELLMVDRKDPGSGLDIRAVGFQAFPAYGDYLTIFAINTHNRFSNAAENEVDLWIDTTGDNIPEYLVATLDYGLVVDGYTDGQLGVFIIDLNEGTLGGYVGSAPHDGSTIYAIMLAADIGLGANKPVGRLLGVDTYPLYNDGGFDLNGGLATFNITDNQRTTGYYAELVRKQKAMFPVTTRRPLANEKISLGWMVSMVNNKSGKEQAKLIYATSGERDDD